MTNKQLKHPLFPSGAYLAWLDMDETASSYSSQSDCSEYPKGLTPTREQYLCKLLDELLCEMCVRIPNVGFKWPDSIAAQEAMIAIAWCYNESDNYPCTVSLADHLRANELIPPNK